ncbi:MAG: radical SAM protein [bacterium]
MKKKITLITPLENKYPMEITSGKVFMPRYGPLALAGVLQKGGYDVVLFDENAGSGIDWNRVRDSDAVCFSLMSFCAKKGYSYIQKARSLSDAAIIIGGLHASMMPEECLDHCDWLIRREGDETLPLLLASIFGGGDTKNIAGISYKKPDGTVTHNPDRPPVADIRHSADPRVVAGYRPLTFRKVMSDIISNHVPRFNVLPVQATRGCPYGCSFCFVKHELGTEYRKRDPDEVVRDIEIGMERLKTNYIFFVDNDLTIDREYTKSLFEKLIGRFPGGLNIYFFARVSLGHDSELLELARGTGKVCVAVGVESINDMTLKQLNKGQTREEIVESLAAFRRHKIDIQALTIFGGENDTVETIRDTVRFYLENRVYNIGICCLYDFPFKKRHFGYEQMWPDHRFIHHDWRFYNGNFVVFYPRLMKPGALQKEILLSFRRFYMKQKKTVFQFHPSLATVKHYIPYLESAEKGLYAPDETLIEDRLHGLQRPDHIPLRVSKTSILNEALLFYMHNFYRPISWNFLRSIAGSV